MRSSSEWNETTTSRPPGLSMRSAAASAAASSPSSSLTNMRSAWKVRVAGWISPGARVHDARDDVGERARGARSAASARALTMARAIGAREALLAERRDDGGKIALGRRVDHVGGARPVAAHAHVERAVLAEGKSALGLVELHRGDAEIEHDAVDRVMAEAARDRFEIGEPVLDQREPAARPLDQLGAARDRALVAVDADHARARRLEDRARIAAGAERARRCRRRRRAASSYSTRGGRARECDGPVRQRQQVAAAARHHSRAPCASSAATREPSCFLQRADLLGGLRELRAEASGLPDLKLVAEADEGDRVRDAGMRLQRVGEDHPALAVDLERLARAVERERESCSRSSE